MAAPAYMLSLLNRQQLLLGAKFLERYPSNWLVWEPGPWRPARSELTSNAEATQLPSPLPSSRPVGDDALCFELKRVASELAVGRGTENQIVLKTSPSRACSCTSSSPTARGACKRRAW